MPVTFQESVEVAPERSVYAASDSGYSDAEDGSGAADSECEDKDDNLKEPTIAEANPDSTPRTEASGSKGVRFGATDTSDGSDEIKGSGSHLVSVVAPKPEQASALRPTLEPTKSLLKQAGRDPTIFELLDPSQRLLVTLADAMASCGAKPRAIDLMVSSLARHLRVPMCGIYILPNQKKTMKIAFKDVAVPGPSNPEDESPSESTINAPVRFACNCSAHTVTCGNAHLDLKRLRNAYNVYRAVCDDEISVDVAQERLQSLLYDQWKLVKATSRGRRHRHWSNFVQVVRRPATLLNRMFRPQHGV